MKKSIRTAETVRVVNSIAPVDISAVGAACAPKKKEPEAKQRHIDLDALFLDEHSAGKFLNVQVTTLRAWRVRGCGPEYCKIGRLVRYPRESLIAFAEKHRVSSTTTAVGA